MNEAAAPPAISFVTTCKGRLSALKQSLPRMVAQPHAEVIVVDYDCPEGTGAWVAAEHPAARVVQVRDAPVFNIARARNLDLARQLDSPNLPRDVRRGIYAQVRQALQRCAEAGTGSARIRITLPPGLEVRLYDWQMKRVWVYEIEPAPAQPAAGAGIVADGTPISSVAEQ